MDNNEYKELEANIKEILINLRYFTKRTNLMISSVTTFEFKDVVVQNTLLPGVTWQTKLDDLIDEELHFARIKNFIDECEHGELLYEYYVNENNHIACSLKFNISPATFYRYKRKAVIELAHLLGINK